MTSLARREKTLKTNSKKNNLNLHSIRRYSLKLSPIDFEMMERWGRELKMALYIRRQSGEWGELGDHVD
ncbi:hypothetical protein OUZ56_027690 [Daphnia magna]|uniref:Uncharacterized protein n=1 Tax=Daphnia magna TaxID=35525 RepID=A0ABR0B1M3_9CRUS|nr:hypothetical protein OUZ56_027690 [Daphnia magna]